MKYYLLALANNPLLQMLLGGVFIYTAFVAIILATLQTPPEAILNSGLKDILMIFEGPA